MRPAVGDQIGEGACLGPRPLGASLAVTEGEGRPAHELIGSCRQLRRLDVRRDGIEAEPRGEHRERLAYASEVLPLELRGGAVGLSGDRGEPARRFARGGDRGLRRLDLGDGALEAIQRIVALPMAPQPPRDRGQLGSVPVKPPPRLRERPGAALDLAGQCERLLSTCGGVGGRTLGVGGEVRGVDGGVAAQVDHEPLRSSMRIGA